MKVLVTGSEGYIGSVLTPLLQREGLDVTGLDTGFFREAAFVPADTPPPPLLRKDTREVTPDDLRGFDAVAHLADLSNDPMGELKPEITRAINHRGSIALARAAKAAGVPRFVYSSSCSVYGVATTEEVAEESPVNPQTVYAECKVLVEEELKLMADNAFTPVLLRNATAYGASPRMRFDLVLNNLSGSAWTAREIRLQSDGTPWRPLVHIRDIARAFHLALTAPAEAVRGAVLNVGGNDQNYQVRTIADIVREAFDGCPVALTGGGADSRSYRVRFDRIRRVLPDFRCEWDARRGARELREAFERVRLDRDGFTSRHYTRLKQLKYLVEAGRLDGAFHWTPEPPNPEGARHD